VEVKPGDMFYIPAGTVHAIGKGILLAEVQQTSDITYRIYDWNRTGLDGRPRPLHTEQAREAIRYDLRPERIQSSRLETPYFTVERHYWQGPETIDSSQPFILQNTAPGIFDIEGDTLDKGRTFLLWPGRYAVQVIKPGEVLRSGVPVKENSV